MLELLAPAGSMESITAAVQNGADAVYFGYGDFNARRNAKNFSEEEAAAAVSYCHLRGCRVHLTLNTLLTDRELAGAAEVAAHASAIGVDAVIVQDLGVMRMLRQTVPDLPIHASTQMTIHSLDGVKRCADLGASRVVLSRELSRDQIEFICQRSPIEIEVFGHGALCMCYSGQCFFSSVIGGRSGNRGLCAQPCRLKYGWGNRADSYPLSLKDASLAGRQGFTQGYYLDRKGPDMFGVRQEGKEPRELYAQARATYENGEHRKEPVRMYAMIRPDQPAQVAVEDREGHVARVEGPVPEPARNVPLTREKVEGQLSRTGGTPFACEMTAARVEEGLSLPLSALNDLRRQALAALSEQRVAPPERRVLPFHTGVRYENPKQPPCLTLSVSGAEQVTDELLQAGPARIYLPADVGAAHPEVVERCQKAGVEPAVLLPRICWDRERDTLAGQLAALKERGVNAALAGTLGVAQQATELGFTVWGDYGLGVYNSQSLKELKRLGFAGATASFELKLAQIRDLSKAVPMELIAYGRLPLMITENCIVHNHAGQHVCGDGLRLVDRKGARFPVVKAWGCRNEILNAKTLFLADKSGDYARLGLWGARLVFTTESPEDCVRILRRYQGQRGWQPGDYTRGLYYRDVE